MKGSKSTLADLRKLQAAEQATDPARGGAGRGAATRPGSAGKSRTAKGSRTYTGQPGGTTGQPGGTARQEDVSAPRPAPEASALHVPEVPTLDPADHALFQQAMRFVQPLTRHGSRARGAWSRDADALLRARRAHAQGADAQPAAAPHRPRRRPAAALDPEVHEFLQAGCGTDLLRGLRRGKWLPQAILDLHGSSEAEAHDRLERFIVSCVENDIRCVRIVHGKGMGSRHGEPVLKAAVRIHLCRHPGVQAWIQCAEPDGGAGAVTALLRAPRELPLP